MVTGDNPLFPYRSSSYITRFFERCGFAYVHDGSTRKWWTKELLSELNLGASDQHDLPSADLLRVMSELFATKPQKALVLGKSLLRLPLPVPNAPPVSLPNSPALLRSNRAKHVRRPGLLISNRFAVKYNRPLASFFHGSVSLGKTHFATASS